jgi:hypothetical protein
MARSETLAVLAHYTRRYRERVGKMPRKRDRDPVLANTFLGHFGGAETAIHVLDLWFDSPDPWYAEQRFSLEKYSEATNRLVATGHIKPAGTRCRQDLVRQLAAAMFLRPHLRLVHPEGTGRPEPESDQPKGGVARVRPRRPRR